MSVPNWIDQRYALATVALGSASAVMGLLAHRHDTFPLDTKAMEQVQRIGSRYEPIAEVFNEFNWLIAMTAFAVGAIVLLVRRRPDGTLIFILAAGLRPYLNEFKALVDRPRPSGDFPVLDVVGNSSFPSGHVMTAVAYLGLLFILAPQILPRSFVTPARVAAVVVMLLYALSRMWAGVHWLSDTYGAVLWSATLLALLLAFRPALGQVCDRAIESWHAQRST